MASDTVCSPSEVLVKPTVYKASAVDQLSAAGFKPRGLNQGSRALLAALGPVLVLVIFSIRVPVLSSVAALVLVLSRPEHASEDFLVQPRLAALGHVTQQTSQRAARPPSAPKNPERGQTHIQPPDVYVLGLVDCLIK